MENLQHLIPENLHQHFHLLGLRSDAPQLYTLFDVFTLTSDFEALPNVVGEAMATGIPCVVTDTGDTAQLVADRAIVVPTGDMDGIITGWTHLINMSDEERHKIGNLARQRIVDHFSIRRCVQQYEALYTRHGKHEH